MLSKLQDVAIHLGLESIKRVTEGLRGILVSEEVTHDVVMEKYGLEGIAELSAGDRRWEQDGIIHLCAEGGSRESRARPQ